MYWLCVSIQPHFLQSRGEDQLGDLFFEIFGDDYLDHYSLDYDEFEDNQEIDRYVFVHCKEYVKYIDTLRINRYIKNILNSFGDVVTIPEEEILETKSSVQNIIDDDDYRVNRTGFFMFGDIVRVLRGSLSSMNGIIIRRSKKQPDFYIVYFRLFVHKFYKKVHVSNMEFHSSIFKYVKIPIKRGQITKSTKRIKKMIKQYEVLMRDNEQKKLVEDEIDIADVVLSKKRKSKGKAKKK